MKKQFYWIITVLLLATIAPGCKKQIEQAKANALIDYMVSNKWTVYQYLEGATDVSAEFSGYEFQFNRDYTVTGTLNTTSKTGTWSTDNANTTITSNFPGTTAPLSRLNGTWGVYYYDTNGPKFSQTVNGVEMKLVLRKK